jgi:hypothetical protein
VKLLDFSIPMTLNSSQPSTAYPCSSRSNTEFSILSQILCVLFVRDMIVIGWAR